MKPLQAREKTILWVLAMLVVVVGFYNFVYSPKTKEYATLAVQLKAKQEELTRVQAQAARKDELERRMQELQRDLQETEARLPSSKEIPVLLVQLERLAGQVGANLTLIRPGPPQQAPQPPAGQPALRPGGAAPSGPSGPPSVGLVPFGLELNAEGTYDTVQSFLRGIETFPRFIAMSDLRISPLPPKPGESALQPRLSVGVSATTYFVAESGAGR
ncbi:MAG TPA: type 4a pilus biogenesis protein PilO [bacterium]|nr:type 4a pilus biogenesis protein PilO [bacterium]